MSVKHLLLLVASVASCLIGDVCSTSPGYSVTKIVTAQTKTVPAAERVPVGKRSPSRRILFNRHPGYLRDLSYKMDIGHVAFDAGMVESSTIRFAVGFDQGEVRCYTFDRDTLKPQNRSFRVGSVGITCLEYASDGRSLAVGDKSGTIRIWEVTDQSKDVPRSVLHGHNESISFLRFNHDSTRLISVSETERTIRVWDVAGNSEIQAMRAEWPSPAGFRILTELPGSRSFISAPIMSTGDSVVFASQENEGVFTGFTGPMIDSHKFALGEDPLRLSTVPGPDEWKSDSIRVWNSNQPHRIEAIGSSVFATGISRDKKVMLTSMSDGDLVVWDVNRRAKATQMIQGTAAQRLNFVAVSPKGKYAATFVDRKHLQLWQIPPLPPPPHPGHLRTYHVNAALHSVSVSSDGLLIAAGTATGIRYWPMDKPSEWFSKPQKEDRVQEDFSFERPVTTLKFTLNANELTYGTGGADQGDVLGVLVADKYGRKQQHKSVGLRKFEGHTNTIVGAFVINRGTRVISASRDRTVRIWSVEVGLEDDRLELEVPINALDVSPDEIRALLAADDGTIRVIDVATLEETARLTGHGAAVLDVDCSPDGSHFVSASADRTVRVWHGRTLQPIAVLSGHTEAVNSAVSSTWGRYVVSGSADGTVRLWDVDLQQELAVFTGHEKPVTGVTLGPFESCAFSCSTDQTVKMWDLTSFRFSDE